MWVNAYKSKSFFISLAVQWLRLLFHCKGHGFIHMFAPQGQGEKKKILGGSNEGYYGK